MIKKGVEKIAREEHNVEYETSGMNIGTEQAKAELIDITERHNFEQMYQHQYTHMMDRMKKDLIAHQLVGSELQISLRSKKSIMSDEFNKNMKSNQNKLQSKYRLDGLMKVR